MASCRRWRLFHGKVLEIWLRWPAQTALWFCPSSPITLSREQLSAYCFTEEHIPEKYNAQILAPLKSALFASTSLAFCRSRPRLNGGRKRQAIYSSLRNRLGLYRAVCSRAGGIACQSQREPARSGANRRDTSSQAHLRSDSHVSSAAAYAC